MKYLNENGIRQIGMDWPALLDLIPRATYRLKTGEYSQPVKPYLRYNNPQNRIIAMPAYMGGEFGVAGIKWIASFPDNLKRNLPRAHSVILLNDAETGQPNLVINTALVSGIRTAAVSGAMINHYITGMRGRQARFNFGIIGFGPIGRIHLEMIAAAFPDAIDNIFIYDLDPSFANAIPPALKDKVKVCDKWEQVFNNATIFMTCTVSKNRYINMAPAFPSLHLNVSLRDYETAFFKHVDYVIVDSWEEVCRENTDIEMAYKAGSLAEADVYSIIDVFCNEALQQISDKVLMFNPMGMAVYDIAIARYYHDCAVKNNIGIDLED